MVSLVDIDDVLDLFGISDDDIYAKHTIEDALYEGTLKALSLPSAEKERKKGKWIAFDDNTRIAGKCSVCGWESHLCEDDVIGMPYCPNCGAEMTED